MERNGRSVLVREAKGCQNNDGVDGRRGGKVQTISWAEEIVRSLPEENFLSKDSVELDTEKTKLWEHMTHITILKLPINVLWLWQLPSEH